jgi:nuclear cap-binding protein subunit 2
MDTSDSATIAAQPMRVRVRPPPQAACLAAEGDGAPRLYWDRSHYDSPASQVQALHQSSAVYVGNLTFHTRTIQLRSHFSQVLSPGARILQIHPGVDRFKKTPCGFAFVVYEKRQDALAAVQLLSGTFLDGNGIRVELDAGFKDGRQYGRGVSGGQVRDDRRKQQQMMKRNRDEEGDGYYGPGLDGELSAKRRKTF